MKKYILLFLCTFFFPMNVFAVGSAPVSDDKAAVIEAALDAVSQKLSIPKTLTVTTEPIMVLARKDRENYPTDLIDDIDDMESLKEDFHKNKLDGQTREQSSVYKHFFDFENNPRADFEMGVEAFTYRYKEPEFMKLRGNMSGIFGVYTYRPHENKPVSSWKDIFNNNENQVNVFKAEGRFSYGSLDYQSEGTGVDDGIDDYVTEWRGLAGYDIHTKVLNRKTRVTPYMGLGYRYLFDDQGKRTTSTGHWGYDRESYYIYLPLGFETQTNFKNNWSVQLSLEYDLLLDGEQKSHFEDGDPNYNTATNDQNSGHGYRGSCKIMKQTDNLDFFFEPFFRYWHIKDSDLSAITYSGFVVGVGIEPDNKTTEYGARLGVHF